MLHWLPNSCSWCVEFRACSVHVIIFESCCNVFSVCISGALWSKLSNSLLWRISNEKSIMPQEFLPKPRFEKVQTCDTIFFKIMPLRFVQDELRCVGTKHVVLLQSFALCLRLARLRSSGDPWEEGWLKSLKGKPYLDRICKQEFASWLFWHGLAVQFLSGVWETRWKKDRNIRNH